MNTSSNNLDSEELLHLALKATQENDTETSINYLKRAVKQSPENAKATYLLGALHAEIGLYDRAIEEIGKAVELDPKLEAAHFQLGLLHITSGRIPEAIDAWLALDSLGENNPYYLFKSGMIHLTNDEFSECIFLLEKAIGINTVNPAMNNDMRNIIEKAKAALNNSTPKDASTEVTDTNKSGSHVLLSAYNKNKNGKEQ